MSQLGFSGFDSGGSLFNGYGGSSGQQAMSDGYGWGDTFVADAYDSTLGFLSDGLNVWKDYLDIKAGSQIPASGSPDQFAEKVPPVDAQAAASSAPAGGNQWVPGIPNGLLIAGAVLGAVVLFK